MKGRELCKAYYESCIAPLLAEHFPDLSYTAGLLGYGSDVLGYDDEVSRDHMWGPRVYLFLREQDLYLSKEILKVFARNLPYTFMGYSTNFDGEDTDGVRHPLFITQGEVSPLIWVQTIEQYLQEQLHCNDLREMDEYHWLACSEHRLLSLKKAEFYRDDLRVSEYLQPIEYYPEEVRRYLIASCWDSIASEQAFVKRCRQAGDILGAHIICGRIAERLMRLCFLYKREYAPYSKWFGTAFMALDIPQSIKNAMQSLVSAVDTEEQEQALIAAQCAVAVLHNQSGITPPISCAPQSYYGRDILVIFAERFSSAVQKSLTELRNTPLIGSMSQLAGLSEFWDTPSHMEQIKGLYR